MATPYPLINGVYYSFAEFSVTIAGQLFNGFSEFNYTQSVEHGEVYGNAPEKLGNTLGQIKAEGNFGLYLPQYDNLLSILGDGWMGIQVPILIQYFPAGLPLREDQIVGARFKSSAGNNQKGSDASMKKIDFTAFKIIENCIGPLSCIP